MKFLIAALGATFIFSAYASQKIERIFEDESLKKDYITLFLSDGEIVHFDKNNSDLLNKSKLALKNSSVILFDKTGVESPDTADRIKSITVISLSRKLIENPLDKIMLFDPLDNNKLTSMESYNAAQSLMDSFNGETSDDSQCYNRAHMWTYEASYEKGINLGKIWIFFTHKYIRDFEYKWWFHVSPYANVGNQGEKYILDRGFTQVPFSVDNWKNIFIKNKANCPVVTNYMQYENNQDEEYCYLIYSGQYFWQPYQLKNYATNGTIQTKYNEADLKITYKDALITWDGVIPGVDGEDSNDTDGSNTNLPTNNDSDYNPNPSNGDTTTTIPSNNDDPVSTWVLVGESVINSNGFEGEVTRILSQYQVEVRFSNSTRPVLINTQYLAVRRGSTYGYKVGDYIKNMHGEKGKITGIFQDGNVTVMFKGAPKHYWQDPRTLTRRLMYK